MYNLNLNKIVSEIKLNKYKRVLIQLPDGLKPQAFEIVEKIELESDAEVLIWFGSCYGACDLPIGIEKSGIDLVIQFGHTKFVKEVEW